ncbi:restin [Cryptosporidium ubiquitum]|uniref:Restin n=1 Tax=Cryptosporidium ubiquitum TaxID=857276 RepID=A0A1J4MG72_9CRYT|nr:restin [Cryptosporidium ubiquitum]OII73217.1 restin [Cryptosporidium ubiquitum]
MLSSKISKYVQNYLNNKEVTPSEAKELYHRFERVLNNNESFKKVWSKCLIVQDEYQKEKKNIIGTRKTVDMIRNNAFFGVKENFKEIKDLISEYMNEASGLSNKEEDYKRQLKQIDDDIIELSSKRVRHEDEYKEKLEMKMNSDKNLSSVIKKNEELSHELMIKQVNTVALESCSKVKKKEIMNLEEKLKEFEDNTRCILGMISMENTAILSVRAEYTQINEQKKKMVKNLENEREKLIRVAKDSKINIEQLNKKILTNKKQILQLKGEESKKIEIIEKLNEQLVNIKEKNTLEDSNLDKIQTTANAIKSQLARLEEKMRVIKYLWETKIDFNIHEVFDDKEILQQAKKKLSDKNIDISNYIRENGELIIKKNGLIEEIEILKQKLSEQDFNSNKIQKIEIELYEKISKAKMLNSDLLKRQRELSNIEDRISESKQRLFKIKNLFDNISKKRSQETRQKYIKELTELTERLGKKLIQTNPKVNITIESIS